jgi:adenosylcobinamide-GDP ribazoletransferase
VADARIGGRAGHPLARFPAARAGDAVERRLNLIGDFRNLPIHVAHNLYREMAGDPEDYDRFARKSFDCCWHHYTACPNSCVLIIHKYCDLLIFIAVEICKNLRIDPHYMIVHFLGAFAFLTILPVRMPPAHLPGRAFAYFPLVGLVIGVVISGIASVQFVARDMSAFLALAAWVILTGGLHLDGFGDSCDGLLATTTPQRRLEIMKDPRAGTYAVVGLSLLLLGKWLALRAAPPLLLMLPPVMGRWALALAAYSFPYARASGVGAYFREGLERTQVFSATAFAGMIALVFGWPVLLVVLVAPITVFMAGRWASARLGGALTGDVYGAICELTELLCLVILSMM